MTHRTSFTSDGLSIVLIDSITQIVADDSGAVIVTGSHGGISVIEYALRARFGAVFFNDAGGGKDAAGISALPALAARGLVAAAYSHESARIGDAMDGWQNGVVSHANGLALVRGIKPGATIKQAVTMLASS